jgi:hypothetical protein
MFAVAFAFAVAVAVAVALALAFAAALAFDVALAFVLAVILSGAKDPDALNQPPFSDPFQPGSQPPVFFQSTKTPVTSPNKEPSRIKPPRFGFNLDELP